MNSSTPKSVATVRSQPASSKSVRTTSRARKRRRTAASSNASGSARGTLAAPSESQFRPTTKQRLYVEERQAQAQSGQWLSQLATAQRLHLTAPTVSIWNRSDAFLAWFGEQMRRVQPPLVEAAKTSIIKRTIDGNVRFAELFLQMYGLVDVPGVERPGAQSGAAAQAGVSVTFIGLPQPPTAQDAAAVNPPPGSNRVLPPPQLPAPMGGRS